MPNAARKHRHLIAAAISFLIAFAGTLLLYKVAYAHEPMLREFVSAYNAGDLDRLPLAPGATENTSDSAYRDHVELFATTKNRHLTLRNVRWNDAGRITADYQILLDGQEITGSVTFRAQGGLITRIEHDRILWPEQESGLSAADMGQALDKGSTAIALSSGFVEANPLAGGIGPGGAVGIGIAMIGARHLIVRDMALSECIEATRAMSTFGWGPGAHNLAVLAGAGGPAGIALGVIAGVVAWNADYKGDCVDGPVRVEVI